MKTITMLFAQFEKPTVRLDEISREYFGLAPNQAKRLAATGELPVPAFRLGAAKSPWLIHLDDLATYLDKQRQQAKKDHQNLSA